MHYLGVDVAKNHLDVALVSEAGEPLCPGKRYANSVPAILRLLGDLAEPDNTLLVFESTGVYGKRLAHALRGRVGMLCCVNPQVIRNAKTTMTATKTDQVDALAIAQAARALHLTQPQILQRYALTEEPNEDLAVWLTEYDRLRKVIARLKQQTDNLAQHPTSAARKIRVRQRRELRRLEADQKHAAEEIARLSDQDDVRLVASIKGVGRLTAAAVCRKIGTIARFASADQLKAYLGIYPAKRQSGRSAGRARLARHGDGLIRHLLFNCAKSASMWNPACKTLFDRLVAAGHTAMYAWVAVMRKLVQIIFGVLNNKTPWNPTFPLTRNG